MMFSIRYFARRLVRSTGTSLATIVLYALLIWCVCKVIESEALLIAEHELLQDNLDVLCVVSDVRGLKSDDLGVTEAFIDLMTDGGSLVSEYVKDVSLKHTVMYDAEDIISKRLIGISRLSASTLLDPLQGVTIRFFDGYTEDFLETDESLCVVSHELLPFLDQVDGRYMASITAKIPVGDDVGVKYTSVHRVFTVVGTATTMDPWAIFCPWPVMVSMLNDAGAMVYSESMSFSIADNRKLEEFKEIASNYFTEVDFSSDATSFELALTIHDGQYQRTINASQRNIGVTKALKFIMLSLCIGFGISVGCLVFRNRRRELFCMYCLGTPKFDIIMTGFYEQLAISIAGVISGLAFFRAGGASISTDMLVFSFIYILSYTFGSTIVSIRYILKPAMYFMRARE